MATNTPQQQWADVSVRAVPSRARWATVRVDTDEGTYVGRVHVPEGKGRLSDVLLDSRPYIYLTEVTLTDGYTVEPFVALNKHCVRAVRVLDDGAPEMVADRLTPSA